jgi:uncharacterized membrane protein YraQ (UPF0718 family)
MSNRKKIIRISAISGYFLFLILSLIFHFSPGKKIGHNFFSFSLHMLKILPCVFVLIGLFQVWVKRELIERHLGEGSGLMGYIWAVILAGTMVGGLYIAFPIAYSLSIKGAKIGVIFGFIGASAICRVPMAIFEASFLGIRFTAIRILVSIPLVIIASEFLGRYLEKSNYRIMKGETT